MTQKVMYSLGITRKRYFTGPEQKGTR